MRREAPVPLGGDSDAVLRRETTRPLPDLAHEGPGTLVGPVELHLMEQGTRCESGTDAQR